MSFPEATIRLVSTSNRALELWAKSENEPALVTVVTLSTNVQTPLLDLTA